MKQFLTPLMDVFQSLKALFGDEEARVANTIKRHERDNCDQALEMFRHLDPQDQTDILLSLRLFNALKHLVKDGPETVGREKYIEAVQLLIRIHNIAATVLSMSTGPHVDKLDVDTANEVKRIHYSKAALSQSRGPELEASISRMAGNLANLLPRISVITNRVTSTHPEPGVSFTILWPDGARDFLAQFKYLLPALVYLDHLQSELVTARQRVAHYFRSCAAKQKEDTQ